MLNPLYCSMRWVQFVPKSPQGQGQGHRLQKLEERKEYKHCNLYYCNIVPLLHEGMKPLPLPRSGTNPRPLLMGPSLCPLKCPSPKYPPPPSTPPQWPEGGGGGCVMGPPPPPSPC